MVLPFGVDVELQINLMMPRSASGGISMVSFAILFVVLLSWFFAFASAVFVRLVLDVVMLVFMVRFMLCPFVSFSIVHVLVFLL